MSSLCVEKNENWLLRTESRLYTFLKWSVTVGLVKTDTVEVRIVIVFFPMVADLCHVVPRYIEGENAKESPREYAQSLPFGVFSCGDLRKRHAKLRQIYREKSATKMLRVSYQNKA